MNPKRLKQSVIDIVKLIPKEKVMYFGQIANKIGTSPRTVGWIMSGLSQEECDSIPWYRVVAKDGYISSVKMGLKGQAQKQLLLTEKYLVIDDHVDMDKHLFFEN